LQFSRCFFGGDHSLRECLVCESRARHCDKAHLASD
jgi:phosphoribosyl-dephospho-CoA transferase